MADVVVGLERERRVIPLDICLVISLHPDIGSIWTCVHELGMRVMAPQSCCNVYCWHLLTTAVLLFITAAAALQLGVCVLILEQCIGHWRAAVP